MQALLNVAVVVAAAPPTGVTLPFISYGGSSLVTTLAAVGILMSISRFGNETTTRASEMGKLAYARFDFGWGDRRSRVSGTRRSSTAKKSSKPKRTTKRATAAKRTTTTTRTAAKRTAAKAPTKRTASKRQPAHKSPTKRRGTVR